MYCSMVCCVIELVEWNIILWFVFPAKTQTFFIWLSLGRLHDCDSLSLWKMKNEKCFLSRRFRITILIMDVIRIRLLAVAYYSYEVSWRSFRYATPCWQKHPYLYGCGHARVSCVVWLDERIFLKIELLKGNLSLNIDFLFL